MTSKNKLSSIKSSYYKVKFNDTSIRVNITETETSSLFFTLIVLFFLDALFVLLYFQLLRIIEGFVSLIIELIIIILLFFAYSHYKNAQVIWEIDGVKKEIRVDKIFKKVSKDFHYDFESIESVAISQGKFIRNRYHISLLLTNSKRLRILYDTKENSKIIGKKISNLMGIPLLKRNYFKSAILYFNIFFLYLIIIAVLVSLMNIELILGFLLIILFRNILLLLSFIDVYLIKEWLIDYKAYKNKIDNYNK
ncbi:MAG: hypothetical protein EU548_02155 [Promethearchaeota archaeon]|nr:MAG: hypothetical protein EU548_02155 [Candidatus Lokiarchaeota archaeon]